jgi:hypothetical protein
MEVSTLLTLIGSLGFAGYLGIKWYSETVQNERIRKDFHKIFDEQVKRYDEKIAEQKKQATEAVNAARKAHEEYLVMHPDDFDGQRPKSDS